MLVCKACGEENPARAKFCLACAAPLEAEDPKDRESLKTVTVVFCDMTGSTALGEALDPESLRRIMERYYRELRTALERHGGQVEKFIGDAVMAVFGVPTVHEDDAIRAVRAANDMRTGLDELNAELEERWGVRIGTRTGVNTGEVVVGDPEEEESFVSGDAVNVAARLEQAAGSGEILLGSDTYRLVRDAVDAESVEPLTLKGKSEPVPAFRLLRVLPQDHGTGRLDSTLIGREAELERLEAAFEDVITQRRSSLITVVGGAGVGKSRLGYEFVRRIADRAQLLQGRCVSYGEGITFWPVAEVLRQSASLDEADGPAEIRAKLGAQLADTEDAAPVVDRLAALLGVGRASPHQEETFWAIARYLEALSRSCPLLVVFDDIHWAEPTFLDLLEYLEDREADAPVLIAGFARPELRELRRHLATGRGVIALHPLDHTATTELIESRLGAGLPATVMDRISEAAEGNPLFVEEMLQMLIDDGYLERNAAGWQLVKELDEESVPPSIEALLAARLDRLRDRERDIAQRASVAGKVFPRTALVELCPEHVRSELGVHLDSLLRKDFIDPEETSDWDTEAFRFHHVLIRDAAYRSTLKEKRADLHERFADWLSETAPSGTEQEELIGYHLEQAYRLRERLGPPTDRDRRLAARAADALAESAKRAFARDDMPAAANFVERALALTPTDSPERAELGVFLSGALLELGNAEGAQAAVDRAAADATGDPVREAHAALQRAHVRLFSDPDADILAFTPAAEATIPILEEAGDDLGLARAWRLWSAGPWSDGRLAEAAIALALLV